MPRDVLYFNQMPRAAAMLHFLHTLYCFSALVAEKRTGLVAGIFSPLVKPELDLPVEDNETTRELWSAKPSKEAAVSPPRNFDELAQLCRTLIERDIRSVFGTASARRQFHALWSYLRDCESRRPDSRSTNFDALRELVTDDAIFDFWRKHAFHKSKGDWREFKTAAVAMLRIYRALAIAKDARPHEEIKSERQSERRFAKQAMEEASDPDKKPRSQEPSDLVDLLSGRGDEPSSQDADGSSDQQSQQPEESSSQDVDWSSDQPAEPREVRSNRNTDGASDQGKPDEEPDGGVWTSPIVRLRLEPNNSVKFLKGRAIKRLANYLDGVLGADTDIYDPSASKVLADVARQAAEIASPKQIDIGKLQGIARRADLEDVYVHVRDSERRAGAAIQEAKPQSALMGRDQFDLNFVRTLLRVDIFSSWQAQLSTKPRAPRDSSYVEATKEYSEIQTAVVETMLASVYLLGRQGDLAALQLIRFLTDDDKGPQFGPEIPCYFEVIPVSQPVIDRKAVSDIIRKMFAARKQDSETKIVEPWLNEVMVFIEDREGISAVLKEIGSTSVDIPRELQRDLLDIMRQAGPIVRTYFGFDYADRAVSDRLKSAFQPPKKRKLNPHSAAVDQFIERCIDAAKTSNSRGFRSKDYPMLKASFNEGQAGFSLIGLYEELDRLNRRLAGSFPGDKLAVAEAEDSGRFSDVFKQLGFG